MQNHTLWLKSPAAIFTGNALNAGNGLVIKGNKIVELVPSGMTPKTPKNTYLDCSNKVITPRLINTYHHSYQPLTLTAPGPYHLYLITNRRSQQHTLYTSLR